jgi:hypothetical protein
MDLSKYTDEDLKTMRFARMICVEDYVNEMRRRIGLPPYYT